MKRTLGQSFRFVELANDVNEHMPDYVVRRLVAALNQRAQAGQRAAASCCSGSPTRRTPATPASPRLSVCWSSCWPSAPMSVAADPHLAETGSSEGWQRVELTPTELDRADAVILLADHDGFDYDLLAGYQGYLLDTRRRLKGPAVETI